MVEIFQSWSMFVQNIEEDSMKEERCGVYVSIQLIEFRFENLYFNNLFGLSCESHVWFIYFYICTFLLIR